jgi:hypothetical protein
MIRAAASASSVRPPPLFSVSVRIAGCNASHAYGDRDHEERDNDLRSATRPGSADRSLSKRAQRNQGTCKKQHKRQRLVRKDPGQLASSRQRSVLSVAVVGGPQAHQQREA